MAQANGFNGQLAGEGAKDGFSQGFFGPILGRLFGSKADLLFECRYALLGRTGVEVRMVEQFQLANGFEGHFTRFDNFNLGLEILAAGTHAGVDVFDADDFLLCRFNQQCGLGLIDRRCDKCHHACDQCDDQGKGQDSPLVFAKCAPVFDKVETGLLAIGVMQEEVLRRILRCFIGIRHVGARLAQKNDSSMNTVSPGLTGLLISAF